MCAKKGKEREREDKERGSTHHFGVYLQAKADYNKRSHTFRTKNFRRSCASFVSCNSVYSDNKARNLASLTCRYVWRPGWNRNLAVLPGRKMRTINDVNKIVFWVRT